ncbi:YdcF family protein [Legionella spiritensis]|uniref:YdcF family protein n=1 Tax=Legionella spiritensis TaxID=452 RepID=UPI001E470963|nr:ElyC/SanA/YdcF family protein [Legionella spiritensis]
MAPCSGGIRAYLPVCVAGYFFNAPGKIAMVLRHIFEALFSPFCLVMIGFTALLFCLYRHRVPMFLKTGFTVIYAVLLATSLGWLPYVLTTHLENQYHVVDKPDPAISRVVVFSGGQVDIPGKPAGDLLNTASIKRLIEGIRLLRQLPSGKLLLSGGGYGGELPEAERMRQVVSLFALPPGDVILETRSLNTADQAQAIKHWVHEEPFYLVTSAIHMPRAMALCRSQGLHPVAAPADFTFFWNDERWGKFYVPNAHNLVYLTIALHELVGQVWGKLTGEIR